MHENYDDVVRQMEQLGCVFRPKDLPLRIDTARKVTCGKGGKHWYRLYTFAPDRSARRFVVGSFGSYRTGDSVKVDWDRQGLSEETLERYRTEQAAKRELERAAADEDARIAALSAGELWRMASKQGHSPYLERKGVQGEACRYLPDGSIVIPLLRYDRPRHEALRAVQRIYPGPRFDTRTGEALPQKVFTKGLAKNGCAVRLGDVSPDVLIVLVCEGYATGLSIRMALQHELPVYVALDAYNLMFVVEILRREVHPGYFILICADDDWKTADHDGPNPGRNKARRVAKTTERCEVVYPVFNPATRAEKDTDFNDLHLREGLPTVARQLGGVVRAIQERQRG